MSGTLLGAAAALLASTLFSVGLVLQSLETGALPQGEAVGPSSFLVLLRRRRWVAGGLVMVVGFGFHVMALLLAPVTVVQPALAAGLIVLLIAHARQHHEPVSPRELLAVLAIGLGVLGLTLTASQREATASNGALLALVLVPLALLALLPRLLASLGGSGWAGRLGLPATFGAGAAYALTGLTTKLASDGMDRGEGLSTALWLVVTAIAAALALVDQTIALHGRDATQVGVVIYVAPVLVPVLVATLLLGESPSTGARAGGLVLSALAVCIGAAILAGSRHVSALDGRGSSALSGTT